MVDLFSAQQATRLFGVIAAAVDRRHCRPSHHYLCVSAIGTNGLLLVAAAGFLLVIVLVHLLIREKVQLRVAVEDAQQSTLDHGLGGGSFDGFLQLLKSAYMLNQSRFYADDRGRNGWLFLADGTGRQCICRHRRTHATLADSIWSSIFVLQ